MRSPAKRQTLQITSWVKPSVKAELQHIADTEGVTLSRTSGTALEEWLARRSHIQHRGIFQLMIEHAIAHEMRTYSSRIALLLVRSLFTVEQTRAMLAISSAEALTINGIMRSINYANEANRGGNRMGKLGTTYTLRTSKPKRSGILQNALMLSGGFASVALLLMVLASTFYPSGSGAAPGLSHRQVCNKPAGPQVYCHAQVVTHADTGKPLATTSYGSGYNPGDLQSAYSLPAASGTWVSNNKTVAIVDAYDNPTAASDLLAYRKQFGLPLCADNSVSCLFEKVNQSGAASPLPGTNVGWGQEIDLDIEMASATCPDCKIVLVEANSSYFSDLGTAVDRAAAMGASAISNSYGGSEFSSETGSSYDGHFNHPGIAITVSSGDSGYGVEYPAASKYVTAVGGTSLSRNSSVARGWSETAWNGAGSGCSAYEPRQSWQPAIGTCTAHRIVADVSADADPATGVAVYDSFGSTGGANWYVFGGTSVASPIIAGTYALAGNTGSPSDITYGEYPYAHTSSLNDVTSGSNGYCISRRTKANLALCTAVSGFDGPTGYGTPSGLNAF